MITDAKVMVQRLRSFFSRSDWVIFFLRLSRLKDSTLAPGLVMIQIDGLSHQQLKSAMDRGHMPFLKSLMVHEKYRLHSLYSGIPSNTPAFQGELFYGVKTCVPAFSFVDVHSTHVIKMSDTTFVESLEDSLKTKGKGLLVRGSSYSNIFTGGATEAHCCWGKMGWDGVLHAINPLVFPLLFIFYIDVFMRTFFLLIVEGVLAVYESIKGTFKGRIFAKEFEIVWLRVLICVCLREFITAGASMDIRRGLPIIHLNLLGYDEQAHSRGPGSKFAHWSLQGIDDAIKRIDRVIKQSPQREYDLWVYSDHGQEKTVPYLIKYGCTVENAIDIVFKNHHVVTAAMGPMGHIYVKEHMSRSIRDNFAKRLNQEANIPLVITRLDTKRVTAWTKRGSFVLPDQAVAVFGQNHPFLEDVTVDVIQACFHESAGDLIILGWCEGEQAISFPLEYGAHAGTGKQETGAFALLPQDAHVHLAGKKYLRPMQLREAVFAHLEEKPFVRISNENVSSKPVKTLRVMTYNVHGCKGMDGRVSVNRIARVIARHNPDVVALQELDVGRLRSFGVNQAAVIAQRLGMEYHFHPSFYYVDEQYGNAILSRYPMELIKKDSLPKLWNQAFLESRGAIWVMINQQNVRINIINTHLSIWSKERLVQVRALLSDEWLSRKDCDGSIVLCGDLNMEPHSSVYKEICKRLKDSQLMLAGHKPIETWFAGYPFRRIDHIFVTPTFKVKSVEVIHTSLEKKASDHLPIIAELIF